MTTTTLKGLIEHHEVNARAVLTVGPQSPAWTSDTFEPPAEGALKPGSLVRVIPAATATDERIGEVKRWLFDSGAAGVLLMPRATGRTAVPGDVEGETPEEPAAPTTGDLRAAVVAEADALVGAKNADAVKACVEEALAAVGL